MKRLAALAFFALALTGCYDEYSRAASESEVLRQHRVFSEAYRDAMNIHLAEVGVHGRAIFGKGSGGCCAVPARSLASVGGLGAPRRARRPMTTARVSVTQIEQYRLWKTGDWLPESELIASIKGEFHPNRKMLCGMAFHAILEDPRACAMPGSDAYQFDGIRLPGAIVQEALSHYDRQGIPEVKATRIYNIAGGPVEVVAKVDVLHGREITETKTRWSTFDADKYADGCQWRYYLDVFQGATSVRYVVFQMDENAAGEFSLRGVHKFACYPYPEIHQDCTNLLGEFMEYCELRGLVPFLVQRKAAV